MTTIELKVAIDNHMKKRIVFVLLKVMHTIAVETKY